MATDRLSKRPWVLLPGTLCTAAVFDSLLDSLGVMPDDRTHVKLDRPSIEDYQPDLEGLGADTIVCGFSLGAIVAAHFAARMKVNRLVLFGINPYADDPANTLPRQDLAKDVGAKGGAAALKTRLSEVYGPRPDATRERICQMAEETGHLIEAQTQLALSRPGALKALSQAKMPVLVVTGSHDQAAPVTRGQAAARSAPDGQFCELDGLGHFALMENPVACANAVRTWQEARQ